MKKEALDIITKTNTPTFSVSTLIPKQWLMNEERLWDRKITNSESIKNYLNRDISVFLSKNSHAVPVKEGEVRLAFDLRAGKVFGERQSLFVFGRYKKLIAGLSQSRWICKSCKGRGCKKCGGKGKNYESVEERIGEILKQEFNASAYTMHASGREDVDATNTAGRPFVMEIKNTENRNGSLENAGKQINKGMEVVVCDLRIVGRTFIEVVSESHFDKEYEIDVEFEKEVDESELKKILMLAGKTLEQRTPSRVTHRRADLIRKRRIIELELLKTLDPRHKTFRILAEAGTYIKELVFGDNGRTKPSFAEVLGFGAKCTRLNVSKICDGFLELCVSKTE
jgi:tRNA pseudouridine synthase 10